MSEWLHHSVKDVVKGQWGTKGTDEEEEGEGVTLSGRLIEGGESLCLLSLSSFFSFHLRPSSCWEKSEE